MDVKSTWVPTCIEWIMFHGYLDYFQKPPLGGRPNTKPGDHGTPNAHNRWFILFYHVWGPAWIEIHWNSIWLRARSHMTSHYTWGSMTTLHDFGGVLGRPLDTFFWALTIPWSRLLARVWSGPQRPQPRTPLLLLFYFWWFGTTRWLGHIKTWLDFHFEFLGTLRNGRAIH